MKHTLDELLDIVYQYYPRGVEIVDGDLDVKAIRDSEEHARLVAARRKAATDERWHSMRRRIQERFPDAPLMDHSLHLPTGNHDACYSFTVSPPRSPPPKSPEYHHLWFQVSFLAPYYIIFSSGRTTQEIVTPPRAFRIVSHGLMIDLPTSVAGSGLLLNPDDETLKGVTIKERKFIFTFDLAPDERSYAEWIAREIEATFGCEPMPRQIGTVIVPDIVTESRKIGEVRLYDCLFSDNHPWVQPGAPEVRAPALHIDTNRLTDKGIAVLTVLTALYLLVLAVIAQKSCAVNVQMEGAVLSKEEMRKTLAWIRELIESPEAPQDIAKRGDIEAALRELEALVTAWDGDGAPSDAMVAWASRFLNP